MNQQRRHGIAGIGIKYGIIQGVLSFGVFFAGTLAGMAQNRALTAANALLLIVLMVLAHREFKRTNDGMMTYPQGLGSGTLLSSVGALIRGVLMYVYVKYINTGYLAGVIQAQQAALAQRGITGAQAQVALGMTSSITTPVGIAVTSLVTGVIVGFIVALIVSIFTQKADPMAVT